MVFGYFSDAIVDGAVFLRGFVINIPVQHGHSYVFLIFHVNFGRVAELPGSSSHHAHPAIGTYAFPGGVRPGRSEEHTSELQSIMRIAYADFCLNKNKEDKDIRHSTM